MSLKFGIVHIPGKGRGVVATTAIAAGETLEVAATVALSAHECDHVEQTRLVDYYFAHPASDDDGLLVLGIGSLVNHADTPNCETRWRHDDGLGWLAILVAIRDIAVDEEITRRYICAPWFDIAS